MMLAGCSTAPVRIAYTSDQQARAVVPGYGDIRHWSDSPAAAWSVWSNTWIRDRAAIGVAAPTAILAISTGSDKSAFSAGYLAGCTRSGRRPAFDLVTGVSTGALIAPFAFLGSSHDADLAAIYTGIQQKYVYRSRPLNLFFGKPSLADTKPLRALIEAHVDIALLDRNAAEHRKGRCLLVLTTDLHAGQGVLWDIGGIATSAVPSRLALIWNILLASSSSPGIFPPMLIDVAAGGHAFSELHVDGDTTASFFRLTPAAIWNGGAARDRADPGTQIAVHQLPPCYAPAAGLPIIGEA